MHAIEISAEMKSGGQAGSIWSENSTPLGNSGEKMLIREKV